MVGGMQELTEGIVQRLDKEKAKTGKKVNEIGRDEKKGLYELRFDDGSAMSADAVIVTLPSFAAARAVDGLDKSLAAELAKIPFVDSATISLGFSRKDLGDAPHGFGIIVPLAEKRKLMACTWSSNKWAHRAEEGLFLARGFVGGAKNQEYVDLSDEKLIDLVRSEFRDIAGITAEPKVARVFRWRKGMAQYTLGHLKRVAAIEEKASALPGFYLAGNSYRGVGISDCIKSGRKAAEKAVGHLKA
jgi:oxygen-dependent protoporphyrinogen oxidase